MLVRVAALIVAPTPAAFACEAREGAGPVAPRPRYAGGRARLLATCPAEAQRFIAWQQELAERVDRERPVVENDDSLFPTADAAQNLINALSADQRAWVPIDSVRDRVIVQVARGDNEVLAYLRENVEEPERITTETVRWSGENLATFADRLDTLPNASSWGYGLNSANGRIEVGVPGDAGEARRRISEVIDPCAFRVRDNVSSMRPN